MLEKGGPRENRFGSKQEKALPPQQVQSFLRKLREDSGTNTSRLALEFMILTVAHMKQVIGARFSEFDLAGEVWIIPAAQTKTGRAFKMPLSPRAVAVVERAREIDWDRNFVFPGRKANKPLSAMTFPMMFRRMQVDATAEGFRSSFRAWAVERTDFGSEITEMALEQSAGSTCPSDDLFETYRQLMNTCAAFLHSTPTDA